MNYCLKIVLIWTGTGSIVVTYLPYYSLLANRCDDQLSASTLYIGPSAAALCWSVLLSLCTSLRTFQGLSFFRNSSISSSWSLSDSHTAVYKQSCIFIYHVNFRTGWSVKYCRTCTKICSCVWNTPETLHRLYFETFRVSFHMKAAYGLL